MDINVIIAQIVEFFQSGIGRILAVIGETLYRIAYPSNAEAAHVNPEIRDTALDAKDAVKDTVKDAATALDERSSSATK